MFLPRTMPVLRSWAVTFVVIIFACVQISTAAKLVFEAEHGGDVARYKVIKKNVPLELKCNIDEPGFTITWQKDGEELKDYPVTTEPFKDGKETSILKILKPVDLDAGLYSCVAKNNATVEADGLKDSVQVVSLPTGSLEQDIIVVEGEKLTLDCQPTGIPTPKVTWYFMKDGNNTLNTSNERYKFLPHNNVTNAVLEIRDVQMSDRGEYRCVLANTATMFVGPDVTLKTNVRVKDKLAALWPFLGICAEVIVLCAIIFIYEKKRNKAELDESDTDNSPEQKNTPDHGKDSVRQRK
ncbi:hypothetical protein R5R35_000969 [Gryllus longicercus]|uniref:Ig-like domain-containing protein n=1 Tax=Gryllus longicercus TaxID=2509291 RepID=A0AAN9YTA3_9ORTH